MPCILLWAVWLISEEAFLFVSACEQWICKTSDGLGSCAPWPPNFTWMLPSVLSAYQLFGFDDRFLRSWTRWQGRVEQSPVLRIKNIHHQQVCLTLCGAPCHHTWQIWFELFQHLHKTFNKRKLFCSIPGWNCCWWQMQSLLYIYVSENEIYCMPFIH